MSDHDALMDEARRKLWTAMWRWMQSNEPAFVTLPDFAEYEAVAEKAGYQRGFREWGSCRNYPPCSPEGWPQGVMVFGDDWKKSYPGYPCSYHAKLAEASHAD